MLARPRFDSGGCLDFALVSRSLMGLSTCSLDWQCPFKPHAGFFLTVDVTQACIPVPQLKGFWAINVSTWTGRRPGDAG